MKKKMLINVADEEESRVAIVEDGILEEFTIETSSKEQIKGNIYNGVIVKVEPSLQAAFVDYGGRRHGFLPVGEIQPRWYGSEVRGDDRERRPRIQDIMRRNQKVIVQVVKEELGTKGASLSTYVSLPGRYLVLMPGSETPGGISRKIEDEEERKKLKEIVTQLDPPPDMGVIVRTAGLNRNKAELQRDMAYLQRLWASIEDKSQQSPAPALIYQEHDLVIRSIRDYFTPDIQEVLVDHREVYHQARDFFQAVMPRYHARVKLYRENKPLFAKYQLEEQLETIYSHKVELKAGGSIVIDPTEALVSIDVNSGRATREKTIEETAFKTNMEAAQEIARQLRLRDLGGLIVIDFIDMRNLKHIQDIEKTLRLAVKRDKARIQISRISQFGLLELSRQRLKPTILEGNYLKCPHCEGSGLIKSTVSLALMVLRRIRAEAARETLAAVKALLPMDVALYLLNQKRKEIVQLEEAYSIVMHLAGNPSARQNEYSIEFIKRDPTAEIVSPVARVFNQESVAVVSKPEPPAMVAYEEEDVEPEELTGAYQEEDVEPEDVEPEDVEPEESTGTLEEEILPPVQAEEVVAPEDELEDVVTEMPEPLPEPEVVTVSTPAPSAPHESVPPEVAMATMVGRGRVFWRVNAVTRYPATMQVVPEPQGAPLQPRGRNTSGRLSRRPRGWWRRRSKSGASNAAAKTTAKASESLAPASE